MATLPQSAVISFFSFHLALAQYYPFCLDGISAPDFSRDSQVDVIFAQAPLFSTNPKIGEKLGLLNLFHSSLLFAQGEGASRRYWTLEFDFIGGNLIRGLIPEIVVNQSSHVESLEWHSAARYCLTNGLLWTRKHWSKRFDVLMSLPADDAARAFHDFMSAYNSTSSNDAGAQYQLWRVAKTNIWGDVEATFVKDTTCADGAVWFAHYLSTIAKVGSAAPIDLRATVVVVEATHVEAVNTNDVDEWRNIVDFYKKLTDLTSGNSSIVHKLVVLAEVFFERKYVYDSNVGVYYAVYGNYVPWMRWEYAHFPLTGPPWGAAKVGLQSVNSSGSSLVI